MKVKINDDKTYLWQWDTGQSIEILDGGKSREVHFSFETDQEALAVKIREENGARLADIPNILLQRSGWLQAHLYNETEVLYRFGFEIQQRPKPADYIYTETEVLSYAALAERISVLEGADPGDSTVKSVNGVSPDENGNITISIPETVTDEHINGLIDMKLEAIENGTY